MGRSEQLAGAALEAVLSDGQDTIPYWVHVPTRQTTAGQYRKGTVALDSVGCGHDGVLIVADSKWIGLDTKVARSILKPAQRDVADQALAANARVAVLAGRWGGSATQVAVMPWAILREAVSVEFEHFRAEDWRLALVQIPQGADQWGDR